MTILGYLAVWVVACVIVACFLAGASQDEPR